MPARTRRRRGRPRTQARVRAQPEQLGAAWDQALAASGLAYQERGLTSAQRESRGQSAAVANGTNLFPALEASDVNVAPAGNYVTVTVTYDFHMILPALGSGGTWTLTRSVRMPLMP